jgi:hypothetical protein
MWFVVKVGITVLVLVLLVVSLGLIWVATIGRYLTPNRPGLWR